MIRPHISISQKHPEKKEYHFSDLKMPKLDWTSETAVVKQSMGVLVALLSNFVYIIVLVVGYVACRCLRHFSDLR